VTEAARVLLVAVVLAAIGLGAVAWRIARVDANDPTRLIGELLFGQWTALLLATVGGAWIGAAASRSGVPLGGVEVTIGIATIVFAAWTLHLETRQSLLMLAAAFLGHALIDTAHRPDWLAADLVPRWFVVGCAAHNLYMAALCYWVQRR